MKLETFIWIFCILIMTGLTSRLIYNFTTYDCDKCTVDLKNTMSCGGTAYIFEDINITKLLIAYRDEGKCLFTWDPTNGFMRNGY